MTTTNSSMVEIIVICIYNSLLPFFQRDVLILEPSGSDILSCVSKGKREKVECRNHIRVIQPMDSGARLYVCGTNAHNPKDYVINVSIDNGRP
ncbi:PREDICTED: semaphorin-2A-like [Rhagoletis zephyria]|uniref:semaphorin-2A-like n=1 Tax=Rhagoletis zephyria TaxID=28612 RepID=UPI000811204C|nr:PREDICTED: semaphorin-2A-like [Rhagoletis zephyria]